MIEFCCRSTLAERPKNVWLYGRFLLAAYHFFNAFGLILNVRRHSMARKQAMRLAESDGLGRCACLLGAAVCKHDRKRQKAIHILKLFRDMQPVSGGVCHQPLEKGAMTLGEHRVLYICCLSPELFLDNPVITIV